MIRQVPLLERVAQYSLAHGIAATSEYQLGRTVRLFGDFLKHTPTAHDLADETVSRWLQWLERDYAQRTIAGHRVKLLIVWRDCADRGLCDAPNRVRKVKMPEPCPIAWTADEIAAIVAQCRTLTGQMPSGVPRREYSLALILAAYDTGLRRMDLWTLPRSRVRPDGSIVMSQNKTGGAHQPRLRAEALRLFNELPGKTPLECPYACPTAWYRWWKQCVTEPAGVRHGVLQQTRRTGATHLATDHRESVQRYLGHKTAGMQRHYIDESIANPIQHLPPELG